MQNIEIIPVRPELLDDVLFLQTECGLSAWTREGYLDELQRPDSVLIAARVGEKTAGFLAGRCPESAGSARSQGDIYNIGTRAAFRRNGVGTALLEFFIKTCEIRGIEKIWLDVRQSNEIAKTFYRKHGFARTGTRKSFYRNPTEDADVMCRLVSQRRLEQRYRGA